MNKKNMFLLVLLLCIMSIAFSQPDSIGVKPLQSKIKKMLDSTINDLKDNGSKNIVAFFAFGITTKGGSIVWEDHEKIKCVKITYKEDKIKTKKLSCSKIDKQLFYDAWKNPVFIDILNNGKQSYISHNINLFIRVINSSIDRELNFNYSNYLGNKDDNNIKVVKELMHLAN